ncbi:MAG: AAA family ATPase [Desulfurococcales archaeon]|nr:AAA family ATPase [Desulfurococcales archaeon]
MYVLIIAGTPGTGKTSVAKLLASYLGCTHTNATIELQKVGGAVRDPTGRHTLLATKAGIERAAASLRERAARGCIILETVFPREWYEALEDVVLAIVLLRTHPQELEGRLREKGWPEEKIIENVLAEAFNEVAEEILEISHDVVEVDTTAKTPRESASKVLEKLLKWRTGISIDWLSLSEVAELVTKLSLRLDTDKYRLGV